MKEKQTGRISEGDLRQLSREPTEQGLDFRPANDIAAEPQDKFESEGNYPTREEASDDRTIPRFSLRAGRGQTSDSITMSDGTSEVLVDGHAGQGNGAATTSVDYSSQQIMEKWALDNAPPPIKVRREGETPEESSPPDLSPPPSPKRMRELARKDHNHDLTFSKVFSQDSI